MKTVGTILLTAFALLPWCTASLFAQQSTTNGEKKIVINKRTIDTDGTETTETIIKKGKAAENFDVDQYVKANTADNVQLDVRVEDGSDEDNTVIVNRSINNSVNQDINREFNRSGNWSYSNGNAGSWSGSCDDNRSFLGVEEDSDEDADEPGLTVQVVRGSAADKAGLRTNDIILQLNGTAVNEWDDLTTIINAAKPGDKMKIAYTRKGKAATTEATLTRRSDVKCDPEACKHGFMGINSEDDDDDDDSAAGVKISVIANAGAAKAGLKAGDVLLKLNDEEVKDWEDITDFMSYTKPGDKIQVVYRRNGQQNTATVELGEQKVSSLSVANWQPENFNIKIREKEACLGVYTSAYGEGDQKGAKISDFTDESAARDAQMSAGDVITTVNGTRVKGHDELWDQIAKYHPGDKVTVQYLRDNQPLQIEATLKACKDNSNRVMIFDNNDGQKNREFYLFNWDKEDQHRLSQHRVITIHRGSEGDAEKINAAPANNAPARDRSLNLDGFKAYPNPSQGQVTVEFHAEPVPTIVSLLDMTGRQLFREELNSFNGDYFQQFDLSEYAKGTIVIRVQQSEKVFTDQVIVN